MSKSTLWRLSKGAVAIVALAAVASIVGLASGSFSSRATVAGAATPHTAFCDTVLSGFSPAAPPALGSATTVTAAEAQALDAWAYDSDVVAQWLTENASTGSARVDLDGVTAAFAGLRHAVGALLADQAADAAQPTSAHAAALTAALAVVRHEVGAAYDSLVVAGDSASLACGHAA